MKNIGQSVLHRFHGVCPGIRRRGRRLRGDSGQAIAEFAIVLALLGVPLLMGTTDMALLIYGSIEVSNAAHAGAMYGMTSANYAAETPQIASAAQAEASDFIASALTVTPTTYYACSGAEDGTQYTGTNGQVNSTALTNVSAVCAAGQPNHYLEFVKVTVTAPVTPPFHFPGLPSTFNLHSTSVMEVEQ